MLKRRLKRHILISTAAIFTMLLIYLFPNETKLDDVSYTFQDINERYVYLLNDNNLLNKVKVIISSGDFYDEVTEVLEVLIKDGKKESSIPNGLRSVIPSNTKINGISYLDNIIHVDFSTDILNIDSAEAISMIESIIYTLTEFDSVSKVSISIEGNPLYKLKDIFIPTLLTRDFGINKVYEVTSLDNIHKVNEYYVSKYNDNYYYVPITKYTNDNSDKIKIIIEDLASSNISQIGLMSFINNNTKLIDYKYENNKMELIFNEYIFDDYLKENILEEVINTISYSISDNYDVDEVVFYNGNKEIYKSSLKSIE